MEGESSMIMRRSHDHHPGWRRSLLRLSIVLVSVVMCYVISSVSMVDLQQQAQAATQISAAPPPGICYQAHVQNIGWQGAVCNGQQAGTTGQSLRMEALRIWLIRPSGRMRVCYQAHVQNIGWQRWVCNGQQAGTTGQSLRMEAIRIVLVNAPARWNVCYQAHVQNIGWQGQVCNGQQAGTTGQSLRMEAIQIYLRRR